MGRAMVVKRRLHGVEEQKFETWVCLEIGSRSWGSVERPYVGWYGIEGWAVDGEVEAISSERSCSLGQGFVG